MLHGHGDDAYRYSKEIIADFSTNVWYGGEPAGLKEYLFQNWSVINRYPEVLGESLVLKVSGHHHLQPESILVANGTTESIYLIAQAFKSTRTAIAIPSFSEYEDACRLYDHELVFIDWRDLHAEQKLGCNLFFICNPNNPTGEVFSQLEVMIKNNPATVFVIDEAFIEFTCSIESFIPLINGYDNVVVLRSLTKAFAIPGLRLGYIVAQPQLIEKLKLLKMPWSVNALAIGAGNFIFENHSKFALPLQQLLSDKDSFVLQLQDAPVTLEKSHTHFFLAKADCGTAKNLKEYLIQHHQLLIRDASNFRGLGPQHFRIATLQADKNKLLTEALKEWKKYCC